MKRKQKNIAIALLWVFLGISAIPLFLPDAPPSTSDKEIRLVQFEEADDAAGRGLLRSATESCEETTRPNDFIAFSFIQDFHLASCKTRLAQSIESNHAKRPKECIYLKHSSLII